MRLGERKSLTVTQQFVNLRSNPICAGGGTLHSGRLSWVYETSPVALGRVYRARIEYAYQDTPDVFIEDPDLSALADGRDLPHVYRNPTRLCLYLPRTYEWRSWMRLDQTIVPWTSLWLFYFEDWLATDDWKGGGEHPIVDTPRRSNRRSSHRETAQHIGAAE